ncbi:uncharacterized protein PV09_04541 [Verruconis gallopava]|uniref:Aminotransferase class V domain-containing protein n=1 Tax=Verruconis gallopava TaxID=253628 RepID=A0A0D2ACN1_9PEZI|nr:uncharacterized protein PV09_04541 [Verruconis gallopava]KIW04235.1 hypothetical protein PV09_04541 [Verruconis gallopava]
MVMLASTSPLVLERHPHIAGPKGSSTHSVNTLYDEKAQSNIHLNSTTSSSTLFQPVKIQAAKQEAPLARRDVITRIKKALKGSNAKAKGSLDPGVPYKFSTASASSSVISTDNLKNKLEGYNMKVEKLRSVEYPDLKGRAYLDNAGTQLPAKSLVDKFAKDLGAHIYGNPHTHSLPARNSSSRVATVRKRALEFFRANADDYDLVFVANASAAIKLVGESIKDYVDSMNDERKGMNASKFWYGYHKDAHNSLIGTRELTKANSHCFKDDDEVEQWIQGLSQEATTSSDGSDSAIVSLFAYPGQSNMTGRRLPLRWLKDIKTRSSNVFTLLDAAALATTKQINVDEWQPDFMAISFYKIFGFPDLGGLLIRKSAAHLFSKKKYFAGGTVDGVTVLEKPFMVRRTPLNEQLEEGTLPFHNIIALDHALDVHRKLFTNMDTISSHVAALTGYCYAQLRTLKHKTEQPLCEIYSTSSIGDPSTHGGTISFNVYRSDGSKVGYRSVEQAADKANLYVRSGAMCNPGGMATHLGWSPEELENVFKAGMRCSKPIEVWQGKWTGVVRVSFGANSTRSDVDMLIDFLKRVYVNGADGHPPVAAAS